MNSHEKALARILFQNKVYKSDGQAFEDLFTDVMSYAVSDFQKIKAWGNIGDRKNDGYIASKAIYYQVFAPEDIRKSYPQAVSKINTDFKGLIQQWNPVNEFYFVVNDKFNGVNADSEQALKSIENNYSLNASGFFTSTDLERVLFQLDDDQIEAIIGFLPNPDLLHLDYSILNEVVGYIMRMPLKPIIGVIKFPDWHEKIQFNNLTDNATYLLNHGSQQLGALNTYLNQNTTLADELQKQLSGVYVEIKNEWKDFNITGDNIFWELINRCSPKAEQAYQNAVVTIMAKYFESCDIFEEPINE